MQKIVEMIIFGKYKLLEKIGNGSFGTVFIGESLRTNKKVAIKLESKSADKNFLKREAKLYQYLAHHDGIVKIKNFGSSENYNYLVLPLLGDSLSQVNASFKTTIQIALQMFDIIEYIHSKGIVHRDLKPDNFLFSRTSESKTFLIDFGLAKRYIDNEGEHIPLKMGKSLVGSINYSSINVQQGVEASRRDDLESIVYIILFLLKNGIPWENCISKEVLKKKQECHEEPIQHLLVYCRSLNFKEKPNYSILYDICKKYMV